MVWLKRGAIANKTHTSVQAQARATANGKKNACFTDLVLLFII